MSLEGSGGGVTESDVGWQRVPNRGCSHRKRASSNVSSRRAAILMSYCDLRLVGACVCLIISM